MYRRRLSYDQLVHTAPNPQLSLIKDPRNLPRMVHATPVPNDVAAPMIRDIRNEPTVDALDRQDDREIFETNESNRHWIIRDALRQVNAGHGDLYMLPENVSPQLVDSVIEETMIAYAPSILNAQPSQTGPSTAEPEYGMEGDFSPFALAHIDQPQQAFTEDEVRRIAAYRLAEEIMASMLEQSDFRETLSGVVRVGDRGEEYVSGPNKGTIFMDTDLDWVE